MRVLSGLVVLWALLSLARGHESLSLDSSTLDGTWTVRSANRSVKAAARVPGGIYTDLRDAQVLPEDLFYRFNDLTYRWVAHDNWTYTRSFQVDEALLSKQQVQLVLHGVDTVAEVLLNNASLGKMDNMFVRYVFPAKSHLVAGSNLLELRFESPVAAARERYLQQAEQYEVPPTCVPDAYHGECHANHLRKMQASFSWDWGPAFPSVGIWKSVQLEAFDSAVLRSVTTHFVEGESPRLELRAFLEAGAGVASLEGRLEARLLLQDEAVLSVPVELSPDSRGECNASLVLDLPPDEIALWWPNGMGQQPLYNLTVTFYGSSGGESSQVVQKVAFRTLELVQEPVSDNASLGLTFFFRVNGRAMFSKGSNWIPASIFPELSSEPRVVRHLLQSARDANMNMLRVWGGGLYESDLFYQVADELGLLIWQDLMFACSMYPVSSDFLSTVRDEIHQQVIRLQHHPSVALWAGNNENEAALRDNWYGTGGNFEQYHADYVQLYVNTIRPLVLEADPSRPYVVSSPSNGLESESEEFVAANPGSALFGDIHYYNYLSDGWEVSTFPSGRFASEFGFQSLPMLETLSVVSEPTDRSASSEFSQSRQHHPAGYQEIALQAGKRLPVPQDWGTPENFYTFIYFSQINQAMSTKTESEKYRRARSVLEVTGEGLTMGALYWQLNDVWQAPSWASIDIEGRWKLLHYFARDFFAPVIVSPFLTPNRGLHVFVVSDLAQQVLSASVRVAVGRWDTLEPPPAREIARVPLDADSSREVYVEDLDTFLNSWDCPSAAECYLLFSIVAPDAEETPLGPDNVLYPVPLKDAVGLATPNITVSAVRRTRAGDLSVELRTDQVAVFVWLEALRLEGRFSENGFLMPRATHIVLFHPREGSTVTADQLRSALTINSLMNHA